MIYMVNRIRKCTLRHCRGLLRYIYISIYITIQSTLLFKFIKDETFSDSLPTYFRYSCSVRTLMESVSLGQCNKSSWYVHCFFEMTMVNDNRKCVKLVVYWHTHWHTHWHIIIKTKVSLDCNANLKLSILLLFCSFFNTSSVNTPCRNNRGIILLFKTSKYISVIVDCVGIGKESPISLV